MNVLAAPLTPEYPRAVGRYVVYEPFARGGMASVHLGRLIGPVGFSRTFAVKRMHEQFARDPAFVAMFLDEARLVARISHPNVVPTLDVVALEDELLLVMEYVCGASLQELLERCRLDTRLPPTREHARAPRQRKALRRNSGQQTIVGIYGASGVVVDRLGFTCAPLSGATSACRTTSITLGGTITLTPVGGSGGVAFLDSCPSGTIADGHNVYVEQSSGSAAYVSAYSLTCSTMALAST